jgi:hypothetical protein
MIDFSTLEKSDFEWMFNALPLRAREQCAEYVRENMRPLPRDDETYGIKRIYVLDWLRHISQKIESGGEEFEPVRRNMKYREWCNLPEETRSLEMSVVYLASLVEHLMGKDHNTLPDGWKPHSLLSE